MGIYAQDMKVLITRFHYILAILMLMAGCTENPVKFEEIKSNLVEGAVVYIYRPDAVSNIVISPDVLIDGKKITAIKNNEYMYINLPVGKHSISLGLGERYDGHHAIELDLLNQQSHFLRVDTKLKFQMNDLYKRRFDLLIIDKEMALAEIGNCQYVDKKRKQVNGKTIDKTEMASAQNLTESEVQEDGAILTNDPAAKFSISKTQNPFAKSH